MNMCSNLPNNKKGCYEKGGRSLTNSQKKNAGALIFDDKGTMLVNEQIMNSYNSGSIDKKGLHGDLSGSADRDEEGTMYAYEQIMNSYASGSINKSGLHGDLFGKGTEK
jgi:hypothetical protein